MSELNEEILDYLDKNGQLDTYEYANKFNLDHQKVIGAVKSLQTTEGVNYFYCKTNDLFLFK
jgi:phenylalanyl-tRNA synthetase alpha chain